MQVNRTYGHQKSTRVTRAPFTLNFLRMSLGSVNGEVCKFERKKETYNEIPSDGQCRIGGCVCFGHAGVGVGDLGRVGRPGLEGVRAFGSGTVVPFQLDTEDGVSHPASLTGRHGGRVLSSGTMSSRATADSELVMRPVGRWKPACKRWRTPVYFGMWFDAEDNVGGLGLLLHPTSINVYEGDF